MTYSIYNTANGLGGTVRGIAVVNNTIYAATFTAPSSGGVSISTNGGTNFTNYTTANGLGSNRVNDVYVVGSTVYAATQAGLSISTNGGTSYTNYTTSDGLGSNSITKVFAVGNTVYAATKPD
ncbi:MAG: hypothetical protein H6577_24660 [Lewinellaceae bacterium]|nr:hypothetical protein [Lewinellaceae bacterium]